MEGRGPGQEAGNELQATGQVTTKHVWSLWSHRIGIPALAKINTEECGDC